MSILETHQGEIAALLTAVFWTVTALAFERASKLIGSLSLNLLRLLVAFVFYCILNYISAGTLIPMYIDKNSWMLLLLSGFIGFVLGDYFLFKSYEIVSARISMLIMALVPPISAILGIIFLNDSMTLQQIIAMLITLLGIAMTILERGERDINTKKRNLKFKYSIAGILFAFGGTVGQAGGLVLSKAGMADYNAFAASQIRMISGIAGFVVWITIARRWKHLLKATKNNAAMKSLTIGAIFGPFIGVSLSLLAVQKTNIGVAATLMSIVPVLIIVPAIFIYKEKVHFKEMIGALIAVAGAALFFIEL